MPTYGVYPISHSEERITPTQINARKAVLFDAKMFVQDICDAYPLEEYKFTTGPAMPLVIPPTSVMTSAEQALSLILTVADWLLEEK